MKTIGYILLSLSLILTACNQKKPLPSELRDAESLMRTEPKTALQILQNMPVPDPANEEAYATYCLLLVQALDKDYETHTSDSMINVAIDYFSERGDKLRKAWSLYYGGRVYTDMKKTPEAAFHYLKAKEIADQTTDYHLRGLICSNLGTLYRDMKLLDQSFDLRFESLQYYELANDTVGYIYALREIGYEYRLKNQYDSAMWYYNKAIDYSNIIQNYEVQNIVQLGIANVYSDQGLYDDVIYQLRNNVIVNKYNSDAINIFLGRSFYFLNEMDSALYYLSLAEESDKIYVKTETYKTFSNLERKRENYEEASFYYNKYLQCLDSL
ncbi:MAG: hypothetical protein LUG51_14040, partial [Tannerellaceae bacterium]|nr:hypothetical protein [Tannerellaceae bacterium]